MTVHNEDGPVSAINELVKNVKVMTWYFIIAQKENKPANNYDRQCVGIRESK